MRQTILALLIVCAGCSARRAHSPISALDVPYAERAHTTEAASYRMPADDVARVLKLPPLSRATLPDGAREARISDTYNMIAGSPLAVLRLVELPGRPVVGQVVWLWSERREWPRWYRAAQCTDWVEGRRTCVSGATSAPLDWPEVAAQFERLGAWDLREVCEANGTFWTDSGALLLQRLVGAEFQSYQCNTPSRRTDSAAGRTARALHEYYQTVVRQAGGPPPA